MKTPAKNKVYKLRNLVQKLYSLSLFTPACHLPSLPIPFPSLNPAPCLHSLSLLSSLQPVLLLLSLHSVPPSTHTVPSFLCTRVE